MSQDEQLANSFLYEYHSNSPKPKVQKLQRCTPALGLRCWHKDFRLGQARLGQCRSGKEPKHVHCKRSWEIVGAARQIDFW
jgi:hypothetical protein